ncbi:uncharacterized protein [Rhodnius prolixus]|uniref:uncharacterized protein n=1 Tax=Rhodnius prolixus TaxID=13249 RepID=UPI003D188D8B
MYKLKLFIVLNLIFITTVALPKHEFNGKYEGNLLKFGNHNKRNNRVNNIGKLYYVADSHDSVVSNAVKNKSVEILMSEKTYNENRFKEEKQNTELHNMYNNTVHNLQKAVNRLQPKFAVYENNNKLDKKYVKVENKTSRNVTNKGCSATTDQVICAGDGIKKYEPYIDNESSSALNNISPNMQNAFFNKPKNILPSITNVVPNASNDFSQSVLTLVSAEQENTIPLSVLKRPPRATAFEKWSSNYIANNSDDPLAHQLDGKDNQTVYDPNNISAYIRNHPNIPGRKQPFRLISLDPQDTDNHDGPHVPNNHSQPAPSNIGPSHVDYNYIANDTDDPLAHQLDDKDNQTVYDPNNISPNIQNQDPNVTRDVPLSVEIPVKPQNPDIQDGPYVSNNHSQPAPSNIGPSHVDYNYIANDTDDPLAHQLDDKDNQTVYDPNNISPNIQNQDPNVTRDVPLSVEIPVKPQNPDIHDGPYVSNNHPQPAPNNIGPPDDDYNYIPNDRDDPLAHQLDDKDYQTVHDPNYISPYIRNQDPNIPRSELPYWLNSVEPQDADNHYDDYNYIQNDRDDPLAHQLDDKDYQTIHDPNYISPYIRNQDPNIPRSELPYWLNSVEPQDADNHYDDYYYIPYHRDDPLTHQLDDKDYQTVYDPNYISPYIRNQDPNIPRSELPYWLISLEPQDADNHYDDYYYIPYHRDDPLAHQLDDKDNQTIYDANNISPNIQNQYPNVTRDVPLSVEIPVQPQNPDIQDGPYVSNNHPQPAPNNIGPPDDVYNYIPNDRDDPLTHQLDDKDYQTVYDPNYISPYIRNQDPNVPRNIPRSIQYPVKPQTPDIYDGPYVSNNHPQPAPKGLPNYYDDHGYYDDDEYYDGYKDSSIPLTHQLDDKDNQTVHDPNISPNIQNQDPNVPRVVPPSIQIPVIPRHRDYIYRGPRFPMDIFPRDENYFYYIVYDFDDPPTNQLDDKDNQTVHDPNISPNIQNQDPIVPIVVPPSIQIPVKPQHPDNHDEPNFPNNGPQPAPKGLPNYYDDDEYYNGYKNSSIPLTHQLDDKDNQTVYDPNNISPNTQSQDPYVSNNHPQPAPNNTGPPGDDYNYIPNDRDDPLTHQLDDKDNQTVYDPNISPNIQNQDPNVPRVVPPSIQIPVKPQHPDNHDGPCVPNNHLRPAPNNNVPSDGIDNQAVYDTNNISPNIQNQNPNVPRDAPPCIQIPVTGTPCNVPLTWANVPVPSQPNLIPPCNQNIIYVPYYLTPYIPFAMPVGVNIQTPNERNNFLPNNQNVPPTMPSNIPGINLTPLENTDYTINTLQSVEDDDIWPVNAESTSYDITLPRDKHRLALSIKKRSISSSKRGE